MQFFVSVTFVFALYIYIINGVEFSTVVPNFGLENFCSNAQATTKCWRCFVGGKSCTCYSLRNSMSAK